MKMSDQYIDETLNKAQKLLWGGSETENIEAHNIIAKLIKDRMEQNGQIENSQGHKKLVTITIKYSLKTIYKIANS